MTENTTHIRWLETLDNDDVAAVGGKNASLGEMLASLKNRGIRVPDGFATTAEAYRTFVDENGIEADIREHIETWENGDQSLEETGKAIRRLFRTSQFPEDVKKGIRDAYAELGARYGVDDVDVAARSSATAEDLPEASFAGQQETYLNVTGADRLVDACRDCYASLFTDRAISYRAEQGFDHFKVALSVGVQKMVRADQACAGVMFSLDTDTGFPRVVIIDGAWGLGENVVQGAVTPDEWVVYKPLLATDGVTPIVDRSLGSKKKKMVYAKSKKSPTRNKKTTREERDAYVLEDQEVLTLARWATAIEEHYGKPMDMEWAKDGTSGDLYVIQARPETVHSQREAESLKSYTLKEKGKPIVTGEAIGQGIATGRAQVLASADDIDDFEDGSILVTTMTDPDWVPVMKKAQGIVTDRGGRTSHAAIVSRELGIPAAVGCTNATKKVKDRKDVTVSCAEGDEGRVYEGRLDYESHDINLTDVPDTDTDILMNIASPDSAFRWWRLPVRGVGLARMEFIINNVIKIHPLALVHPDQVDDEDDRTRIRELTRRYEDKKEYFVDHLCRSIARIAASRHPDPVIVRMSDFKSNEYADLVGGSSFEPEEDNPMLGFRGASRYYSERYREGFALECAAIKRVREDMGLENVIVMIPFCRTVGEADRVLDQLAENGLVRGEHGLAVYVMAELPANVVLAHAFAERFDGFSIGSNDLTQLVLGVDRDADELSHLFDEQNDAVKDMIATLIERAHEKERKVGLCGQAPSDHPSFAAFLVEAGIDSISVNPDSVVDVIDEVAAAEEKRNGGRG